MNWSIVNLRSPKTMRFKIVFLGVSKHLSVPFQRSTGRSEVDAARARKEKTRCRTWLTQPPEVNSLHGDNNHSSTVVMHRLYAAADEVKFIISWHLLVVTLPGHWRQNSETSSLFFILPLCQNYCTRLWQLPWNTQPQSVSPIYGRIG